MVVLNASQMRPDGCVYGIMLASISLDLILYGTPFIELLNTTHWRNGLPYAPPFPIGDQMYRDTIHATQPPEQPIVPPTPFSYSTCCGLFPLCCPLTHPRNNIMFEVFSSAGHTAEPICGQVIESKWMLALLSNNHCN